MPSNVLFSVITISLALVFYTVGVWAERLQGRLKAWHLAFFWLGLMCDTTGTGVMMEMAGGITLDIHGLTGALAILLMLIHAMWASIVLLRRDERWLNRFHRLSVGVWVIWLIPYLNGFYIAM